MAGEECLTGHRNTVWIHRPEKLCGGNESDFVTGAATTGGATTVFSAGAVSFSNFFFRFFRLFVFRLGRVPLSVFSLVASATTGRGIPVSTPAAWGSYSWATGLGIFTTGNVALGHREWTKMRYSSRLLSKFKCGRLCPEVDCERDTRALTKTLPIIIRRS